MQLPLLAGGAGLVVLLLVVVLWRRGSGASASKQAHDAAQERDPPVEIGGTYEFGITEFTDHHSGDRVAVGKVEGFVLFTDGVPTSCSVGDPIRATVTSFNRGHTSADATYEGRA
ncbi:TRAM domain-containing protein [Haloarcula salinisoli]|uniref:TRAM domain-containing protein n=1 Tax=Haloarcula salinisoli TaxID=2487746 RepID=A0A8J8C7Q5_9EURY|nr:TRAM domain-containing protein [Halomicroarcula salinisoli]MBX0284911.1 TRAM domain-containing protein [Halomicroarcula salinisoli]MBX0303611.1 TRAM domain-containing protein [Halomicroarcula salinisoli]